MTMEGHSNSVMFSKGSILTRGSIYAYALLTKNMTLTFKVTVTSADQVLVRHTLTIIHRKEPVYTLSFGILTLNLGRP